MERHVEERNEFDLLGGFDATEASADHEDEITPKVRRYRLLLIISLIVGFLAAIALVIMGIAQLFADSGQTLAESATSHAEGESANIEGVSMPFVPGFIVFGLAFVGIIVGAVGTGLRGQRA